MPNEKSTGDNPVSGVEAAAAGKTTAQSGPSTRVDAAAVRAPSLDPQSTQAAKDYATHTIKEENQTLRSQSQDFMKSLKGLFSGSRRKRSG